MPFDINAARKAGYNDQEIGQFLTQQHSNFDVSGAMKAGYSLDEIANKLEAPSQKPGLKTMYNVAKTLYNEYTPMGQINKGVQIAGENAATALTTHGVSPNIAAAIGTGVQMIPDMATAFAGTPEAASAGNAIGETIGQGIKTAGKRIAMGKDTEQIMNLRNTVASLAEQKAVKLAQLEELRQTAGSGIETARNAAGIPQQIANLPKIGANLDETAQFFKSTIGSMKPEELVKAYGKDGLAQLRDIAQTTKEAGVSSTQNAFINRGVARIDEALSQVAPDVSNAYKNYGTVQQATEAVPQDFLNKKIALQNQIRTLQPSAAGEIARRRGLGLTVGGGVGYAILSHALRKLGSLGN